MSIKAKLSTKTPCEVILDVEISEEALNAAYEKSFKKYYRVIALPGFRAGKAPREMVEKSYKNEIQNDALETLVPSIISSIVEQHKLIAIYGPYMEQKLEFPQSGDLKFNCTVEVAPAIDLKEDYKKIKLEKNKVEIDDTEINKIIEQILSYYSTYQTIEEDRACKSGDWLTCNYIANCEGKEAFKRENAWVEANSESEFPVAAFGENFVGLKKLEKKSFSVKAPDNFFKKEFAGKDLEFNVELLEIKEKKAATLDEELIKRVDPKCKTEAELRESIKLNQSKYKDNQEAARLKILALEKLEKHYKFPIPPSALNNKLRALINENVRKQFKNDADKAEIEAFVKKNEGDWKTQAEREVREDFIMDTIAHKEKIEIQWADCYPIFQEYAQHFQKPVDWVVDMLKRENKMEIVYKQAANRKVLDFIVANAEITEK